MPTGLSYKDLDAKKIIYGTLKVGFLIKNGYLVGIFEMEAERAKATPKSEAPVKQNGNHKTQK